MGRNRIPLVPRPLTNGSQLALPGDPPIGFGIEARVVTITPGIAGDWLERNHDNRPKKRHNIERYSRDMAHGRWALTGEPIIFDRNGTLRNGQNRLEACVLAQAPFRSLVVWGVDPGAFANMDRGASRTISDVLGIDGEADATTLAAAASYVWRDENGYSLTGGTRASLTVEEVREVLARHPRLRNSTRWRNGATKNDINPSLAVFLHYKFARISQVDADRFFDQFYSGFQLDDGHPIHTLKKQIKDRMNMPLEQKAAYVILAWNAYRDGRKARLLRWSGPGLPKPQ